MPENTVMFPKLSALVLTNRKTVKDIAQIFIVPTEKTAGIGTFPQHLRSERVGKKSMDERTVNDRTPLGRLLIMERHVRSDCSSLINSNILPC